MAYSGYHPMPEGNSYIHVHDSDGTNGVVLWWEDSWVQRDRDPSWSAVGRFLEAPELGPIGDRAVAVGSTLAFELSATDGDGDVLSLSVSGNPVGSSLTGDVFTWAPTADQVGEHVVTFTVDDGRGETDSEAITIAVGEAPPTIVEIPLVAGFNRVGYLPTFYDSTRHALDSILDNMKQILGYERPGGLEPNGRNGATKFNPSEWVDETWGDFFTSMKRMGPRQGYWIEMNAPDTLVYPSSPAPGTPQTPVGKMVATASVRDGQVHPTMWWMGMHGWLTTTGGDPAPAGTVVDVIDGQGNTAGWFEVEHLGGYGYMPIYLDDPATDLDEGADEGEWLTVRVNGDATQYRVQWTEFGDEVRLDMEIGRQASSPSPLPTTYALGSNYPNPFNSTTTIAYELPSEQEVVLLIWNLAGQRARELVHTRQAAGSYSVTWDGRDGTGSPVANGVYLYEIRAGDFQMARKMVLMK